jgi:hypothetical protein
MSLEHVLVSHELAASLMAQAFSSPRHESIALLLGRYEAEEGAEPDHVSIQSYGLLKDATSNASLAHTTLGRSPLQLAN